MSSKKSKVRSRPSSRSAGVLVLKLLNEALKSQQLQKARQDWTAMSRCSDQKQAGQHNWDKTQQPNREREHPVEVDPNAMAPRAAQMPTKEGSIDAVVRDLAIQIDRLGNAVGEMDTRLSAIMAPGVNAGKEAVARPSPNCPLAEILQTFTDRVKTYTNQFQELRARVEL